MSSEEISQAAEEDTAGKVTKRAAGAVSVRHLKSRQKMSTATAKSMVISNRCLAVVASKTVQGGTGGNGGWGRVEGGVGGVGQAPKLSKQLVPGVKGQTSRPTLSVREFCRQYRVSEKICRLLEEEGFETAGSLFEVSDAALQDAGFRSGQIAELQRALKEFLVAAAAATGSGCLRSPPSQRAW
ncbi:hypothetical protein B0H12DRAFT_1106772 [Mycena haematopus]|nr:hypothetical protein B0H12DRAFT_1106772 [Mycena haematopus]